MFLSVKRTPGGAEKMVPSDTRESLMSKSDRYNESQLQKMTSDRKKKTGGEIHEPASQEQVLRVLSVLRQVLQQVRVGRVLDCRSEDLVSLRQISEIREPRSSVVQMENLLNGPIALGRVIVFSGEDVGRRRWGRKREDGNERRRDGQQNGDEEFREHNDKVKKVVRGE